MDAATGRELQTLQGENPGYRRTVFSPDGALLASACREPSDMIQVWDTHTGQKRSVLKGHARFVSCLAFSPDGRRLVSTGPAEGSFLTDVKIWDPQTGNELLSLKSHSAIEKVFFRSDGNQLLGLSSSEADMQVWDATPRDQAPVP